MIRKGVLSLLLFWAGIVLCLAQAVVSPKDGSLWLGTSSEGLYRIGRNGKILQYTVEGGQITSNEQHSLVMTSSGILYYLGADGKLGYYSSVKGFSTYEDFPVDALTLSADSTNVYVLSKNVLYNVASEGSSPTRIVEFSEPVSQLYSAPDGALWILGKTGSFRLNADGELASMEQATSLSNVSELIPFEFETIKKIEASSDTKRSFFWLWALLFFLIGLIIGIVIKTWDKKPKKLATYPVVSTPDITASEKPSTDVSQKQSIEFSKPLVGQFTEATEIQETTIIAETQEEQEKQEVPETSVVSETQEMPFVSETQEVPETPIAAQAVVAVTPENPVKEVPEPAAKAHNKSVQKKVNIGKQATQKPESSQLESALLSSEFGHQVYELVSAHLTDPSYGVEEVASDLGITRIHVNRKLKAQTGYSPSAVFKFIRMNLAAKYLVEGKLSMAEIAQRCGFSSASYFSTAFKDYYSVTPSEYIASQSSDGVLEFD